jgi:3-phytase
MRSISFFRGLAVGCGVLQTLVYLASAAHEVDLLVSARTSEVESDNSAVYYSSRPLLLGNDGSAATGGFHVWSLDSTSPLREVSVKTPGRSKIVATVYDIGKKDLIITIAQPESVFRVFDVKDLKEIKEAQKTAIGDWSALCTWKSSESGNQYFYIFGKKQAVQYLIRYKKERFEIIEVISSFDYAREGG